MINKVHVYMMRHVFVDDEYVGKYNQADRTIRFRPEADEHKDRCLAHFRMVYGIFCKALVGDEELAEVAQVREFPDEVRALMDPRWGDRTPAVLKWALENFTEGEFAQPYPGFASDESVATLIGSAVFQGVDFAAQGAESQSVSRPSGGVTADDMGGPLDQNDDSDGDDSDAAGNLIPGQGGSDSDDDDFKDEDHLREVAPDPDFNDGVMEGDGAAQEPAEAVPGFALVGDEIQLNGKPVATLFGEEKQLRIKQGHGAKKAGVLEFLSTLEPTS